MITSQVHTFLKVAECGSFSKAAQKLYISRVSVMRQIDALEEHVGVPLLVRGSSGVSLTPAGRSLREDAARLLEDSEAAIRKARRAGSGGRPVIRVGSSMLNPCSPLVSLWEEIREEYPQYRLRIIPYSDDHERITELIASLNTDEPFFDVLLAVCDSEAWLPNCSFLRLHDEPIVCAVPISHPLASREKLSVGDLNGQTLMMISEDSPGNARAMEILKRECTDLNIIGVGGFYDVDVFHTCIDNNCLLLSLPVWETMHPGLVQIPIDWDCAIPYGIMYPKRPSPEVQGFIDAIRQYYEGRSEGLS